MTTALVLDALEHAVWTRARDGVTGLAGLVHHHDAGRQYASIAFTERLMQAGADPSVGSVGDAYDNALAETTIGLYKTELIRAEGPWRDLDQVEAATLEWVHWYNTERTHEAIDDLTPDAAQELHYRFRATSIGPDETENRVPGHPGRPQIANGDADRCIRMHR